MAGMIEKICRETDAEARTRVSPDFMSRFRGQLRYFRIEEGFLGLGKEFAELSTQLELHLGKSAKFTAIDRPDLRLTLAYLEDYRDNPFARPFRRGNVTQAESRRFAAGQTSFLEFQRPSMKRQIAALCFGFDKALGFAVPAFIEIRFADAEWQQLNAYHDIRELLLKSREVPTEMVGDERHTTKRITTEKIADLRKTTARRQKNTRNA